VFCFAYRALLASVILWDYLNFYAVLSEYIHDPKNYLPEPPDVSVILIPLSCESIYGYPMYNLLTPLLYSSYARSLVAVIYRCLSLSSLVYIASRYFSWYSTHFGSPTFFSRSPTAWYVATSLFHQ
jgi:hypothetical protein